MLFNIRISVAGLLAATLAAAIAHAGAPPVSAAYIVDLSFNDPSSGVFSDCWYFSGDGTIASGPNVKGKGAYATFLRIGSLTLWDGKFKYDHEFPEGRFRARMRIKVGLAESRFAGSSIAGTFTARRELPTGPVARVNGSFAGRQVENPEAEPFCEGVTE